MKLTVLYFGQVRAAMGSAAREIETECRTAGELFDQLNIAAICGLSKTQVKPAINETFTSHDMTLHEGDTVAYLPPVCGG